MSQRIQYRLLNNRFFARIKPDPGSLAQLARAPRLHRGGQRFESSGIHSLISPAALFDLSLKV